MNVPILEANNVSKIFPDGARALHQIHLTIKAGETMVLIGESGSGKTTLLRLFNRLDDPSAGIISIHGKNVQDQNPILLRRQLGYVQQDGGLLPHWTVSRNVSLVPVLLGWSAKQCQEQVESMLRLVNLDPHQYRDRYPSELSGGQRQRVAFARALASQPDIVLLDEPFGALDALTRDDLQEQFLHMKHTVNKTMVLVTHDLQEAFRLGDRIAVLREGSIQQVGTPDELTHQPANEYVHALLEHARPHRL
ncbi:MAG: ATP-binding cassette domain-containing protein [Nitrospirae bacterium]|nr:ATP-binding cassette domain-containing protein [Nitrospirota bacterium]